MNKLLQAGRILFPLSFLMYVGLHAGKPETGAAFVPDYLPFAFFWNYFTMVCILLFIISALLKKWDKLAYSLMALYVLAMAFMVHLPRALGYEADMATTMMTGDQQRELEMVNFFRNIILASALMGYARYIAADKRVVG